MKAFAYIRVSTEEQAAEGRSLDVQERADRGWCAQQGIELIKVYVETASAFRSDAREVFEQMCRDLESAQYHDVEAVVVWKVIRGTRNLSDWSYLTERARKGKGVIVLSVTEGFPATSSGQLMGGISAAFGRWQSQVIGEQTSANMQAWAERGVYPSRAPSAIETGRAATPKKGV